VRVRHFARKTAGKEGNFAQRRKVRKGGKPKSELSPLVASFASLRETSVVHPSKNSGYSVISSKIPRTLLPLKTRLHKFPRKNLRNFVKKVLIPPAVPIWLLSHPKRAGSWCRLKLQFRPLAGLRTKSEAGWANLFPASSAGQILSVKIEEDGKRVKRRRMARKCRLDDESTPRSRATAATYDL